MKRNEADNDDCEPVEETKEEVKTKRKCVKLDHDIAKLKEKELEMRTVKFKLTNVRAAGSVNAEEFILPDYYDIKKFVGNGGYGIVVMAVDKRFNSLVAIKRIRNPIDSKREDTLKTLREIKMLKFFHHENIVSVKTILNPISKDWLENVWLSKGLHSL